MDESKESFKSHTDKRISEIHERTKKFKAEKLKEKKRKNSETHRKRKKEKVRGRKNMVRVTLELSKLEIEMLSYCIESALDTKHMNEQDVERAKEIKRQLSKYL